ncbi:MAG: 50S ribosomal protein L21 [Bacillota bacterium]|jgi:large subunit ribosomal protein L21
MYAVIETGGKQYRVAEGDTIFVDRLPGEPGQEVVFERVLLVSSPENTKVGQPTVAGASVVGKVLRHGRARKIIVFKYKPKKNYRRTRGHRQVYTQVLIEKIRA